MCLSEAGIAAGCSINSGMAKCGSSQSTSNPCVAGQRGRQLHVVQRLRHPATGGGRHPRSHAKLAPRQRRADRTAEPANRVGSASALVLDSVCRIASIAAERFTSPSTMGITAARAACGRDRLILVAAEDRPLSDRITAVRHGRSDPAPSAAASTSIIGGAKISSPVAASMSMKGGSASHMPCAPSRGSSASSRQCSSCGRMTAPEPPTTASWRTRTRPSRGSTRPDRQRTSAREDALALPRP